MFSSWGLLSSSSSSQKSLRGRSVLGPQLILVSTAKKEGFSLAGNSSSPTSPMHKTCLGLFSTKVTEHLPLWNWAFSYFLTFSSLYQNFPRPPSFLSISLLSAGAKPYFENCQLRQNWKWNVPMICPRLQYVYSLCKTHKPRPNLQFDAE